MRKELVIFGLFLGILFLGLVSFRTYGINRFSSNDLVVLNPQYMMGNRGYEMSYEFIYLHVSTSDQEKLDLAFAQLLITYDFSSMTADDVSEIISQIKIDILEEIELENTSQSYGMMGRSMMGSRTNFSSSCGYQNRRLTYEWLYLHATDAQKEMFDLDFADAILEINLESLTITEVIESITQIKEQLYQQAIILDQPNA